MTIDGHDGYIFYTEETSYGVVADDQTWERMLESASVSGRGGSQEVKDMRRHGKRGRTGSPRGKRDEDALVFEVALTDDDGVTNIYDTFLKEIFEEDYDVATKTYVFLISNHTAPSSATYLEYYYGCILDEAEISIEEGEVIMVSLTFSRQVFVPSESELHVNSSNTYNAYPSTITYLLWSDVTISKVAASGWTNTGTLTNVSSFTITVAQGGEKKFRIDGTKIPKDLHLGTFEVSGSMTVDFDDFSEIVEVTNETGVNILLVLSPAAGTMGQITLLGVAYEGTPYDSEPNSLITIDVDWTADAITFAD